MRPHALVTSAAALALALTTVAGASAQGDSGHHRHGGHRAHEGHHDARDLLRAPLAGSLPTDDAAFLVKPGQAPWEIGDSAVRVRDSGRLDLRVRGLLIPGKGVGPVTSVTASLACNGEVVDTSRSAPLSATGDARIRDDLTVPQRCLAPVVMVNPNGLTGFFIAISGRQR